MEINDIPKDKWFEIPDEKLKKIGKKQIVYIPSNYPGPIAMDATIMDAKFCRMT